MTDNYRASATPAWDDEPPSETPAHEPSTAEVARDQASDVGGSTVQAGQHVADVAREQVSGVAAEAGRHGRHLVRQAQDQLAGQTALGQQRLAGRLFSISDDLRSMAENSGRGGVPADLAHQAASTVRDAGQWLDSRTPRQVAEEIQRFARRRPAMFVGLAAGAGLVAGRLTRGLKDAGSDDSPMAAPVPAPGPGQPWAGSSAGHGLPGAPAVSDEAPAFPDPGAGLPPAGSQPGESGRPLPGDETWLVNDQASRQGTL